MFLEQVCQQQRRSASDESHLSSPHPQPSDKEEEGEEKRETEARSSSKVEKAEKNNDIHVANPTTEEAISESVDHGCVSDKNKDNKALVQTQVPADSNESKNETLLEENENKILFEKYNNVQVKIVDFGNACWVHKHFTNDIQV